MLRVTIVDELPKAKRPFTTKREMDAMLHGFLWKEAKTGRVEGWKSHYKSIDSAQSSLYRAINLRGLPIKVSRSKDHTELYFERTDM